MAGFNNTTPVTPRQCASLYPKLSTKSSRRKKAILRIIPGLLAVLGLEVCSYLVEFFLAVDNLVLGLYDAVVDGFDRNIENKCQTGSLWQNLRSQRMMMAWLG